MTDNSNLITVLQQRVAEAPDKTAYTFLKDGGVVLNSWSYAQLQEYVQAIAANLQARYQVGDRALLVFNAGLDYIAAYWGCLYAGLIAVPAYPPQSHKHDAGRLNAIIEDAGVSVVLTANDILATLQSCLTQEHDIIALDDIDLTAAQSWQMPLINAQSVAFLQYTSGSTAQPKGVMISHANLVHNLALISRALHYTRDDIMVSWLPPYHDMGLIAGILSPIFNGAQGISFSAQAFLQSPFRWLKVMSDYRATLSGAPNFAYEYCVRGISNQQKQQLDLSHWRYAANGAEPIRASTLEKFSAYFSDCGLQASTLFPCYGLAEATVYVSGKVNNCTPLAISRQQLELNTITAPEHADDEKIILSSGTPAKEQQVCIVDPTTLIECNNQQIGEIWIQGDSVAHGYWQKPELTQEAFHARLANASERGEFLRTGDWGFLTDNQELYVTGRMKELIIINGRNHYPQDIMRHVQSASPDLRIDGGAAFSIEVGNEERLVVVQEVERTALRQLNAEMLFSAIRQIISTQHGLKVYGIVLIKPLWLPRTSSGKIQHYRAKIEYLQNSLKTVAVWHETDLPQQVQNTESSRKADELIAWLRSYAKKRINSRLIDERRCILPHIVLDFGNQGLLGMSVPKEFGGLDMDYQNMIRVVAQLAAIDSSLGSFVGIQNSLGILPIINHAKAEAKASLLPKIATGRELVSFAITEENAGSDPKSIKAIATPDKERGGWRINGKKIWIGNASWASVFNVFVQLLDEQNNPLGITGFIVRHDMDGVLMGEEAMTMGVRGMVQNAILLNNAHVTEADLLGEIGQGFSIAQETMQYARLGIAAASLGIMQRALQFMHLYASRRQIGTGLLLNNPVSLAKMTETSLAIISIDALTQTIAQFLDQGLTIPDEIYAICKTTAPELCFQVVDQTMQLLGGRGYCENNLVPQLFRDSRLLRIFEGPTETLNSYLGSVIMHNPEPLYHFVNEILKASDITDEIKICLTKLAIHYKEQPLFADKTAMLRWQQNNIGELISLLVLKAFLIYTSTQRHSAHKKQLISQAINYQDHQYQQRLTQLTRLHAHDMLEQTLLAKFITDIKAQVGETEFIGYGEDHKLDSYLSRTDNNQKLFITETEKTKHREKTAKTLEIEQWIMQWLSNYLKIDAQHIHDDTMLMEYGIDSISAIELAQKLELQFNLTLNPNVVWNFPTVGELASHIENKLQPDPEVSPQIHPSCKDAK